MAAEAESAKAAAEQRLTAEQAQTAVQPKKTVAALVAASNTAAAAVHLDEAETRKLIDQQLNQAGWIADSTTLTYSAGARPEKGKNMAIAEWPTANGPADYMLFSGLTPLAAVEAKRKNTDVSGALQQAKRYSRGFGLSGTLHPLAGRGVSIVFPMAFHRTDDRSCDRSPPAAASGSATSAAPTISGTPSTVGTPPKGSRVYSSGTSSAPT